MDADSELELNRFRGLRRGLGSQQLAEQCLRPDRPALDPTDDAADRHTRAVARKVLGWPKRCKLAQAFLRKHS